MAQIFRRRITGLNYTGFIVDNEVIGPDVRWISFCKGEGLPIPEYDTFSATHAARTTSRVPDILTIRVGNICSQRFKDFVETWEPGLHFFNPVKLKRKNGEPIENYYLWTVGQDIDCILTNGCEGFWERESDGSVSGLNFDEAVTRAACKTKYPVGYDGTEIQISKPAVAGCHLWMGGLLGFGGRGGEQYFMSDEMYAAYKKEKFQNLEFMCVAHEIDQEWVPEMEMGDIVEKWRAREAAIAQHWPKVPARRGRAS